MATAPTPGSRPPAFTALSMRLSLMMFLQFFIWGAWYTTITVYMRNNGMADATAWPFTANAIAAIVSPFFLGLVADRLFATEKVLAVLHLLGGLIMFVVPSAAGDAGLFIGLLILYNLCYMPTLGLANSLAFHHITDQERQFPLIRVFGTIGWIIAGLFISFVLGLFVAENLLPEASPLPLYTTGAASLVLCVYAFSLPHTPPPGKGQPVSVSSIAGVEAFRHLGSRSFYVFIVSSMLICIPLAAYYAYTQAYLEDTGFAFIAATQTLGQMSEIGFMLLMPLLFVRLGVKWMLAVGMGAWAIRYFLFAAGAPESVTWMILTGIVLHGICYDFFFVTGQIYVDKKSTPAIRSQAQGFLVLVTYGVGMLIGTQIAGSLYNSIKGGAEKLTPELWQSFWYYPAVFAVLVLIFFIFTFRDKVQSPPTRTQAEIPGEPQVAKGLSVEGTP